MKNLRHKTERFLYLNRDKGIPNLMLWVMAGNVIAYLFIMADPSFTLYRLLCFDRTMILHGQIWRLFTYIFLDTVGSYVIWLVIAVIFYYQLGQGIEAYWGRLKFNLYYLTGIILLDLAGMIFNIHVSTYSLNLTLFLAYATMFPDQIFRVFFIIPLKARWLGIISLLGNLLTLLQIEDFPANLIPLFALGNYLLYFGKDFLEIFPASWRINARHLFKGKGRKKQAKVIPFNVTVQTGQGKNSGAPYTHRCTVCGRTDVTNPELEFRYCSKCKGYYCYCIDHINNHTHIE